MRMKHKKIPGLLLLSALLGPLPAHAGDQWNIGVEGFYDKYREKVVDVTTTTPFGSITAGYTYNTPYAFGAIDGRFSYGNASYKSPDGTNHTPQYDGEVRLRGGFNFGNFSPYSGVGGRFYLDKGTGTTTNLGYGGYDRHIQQFYIPVGADWQFNLGDGWSLTPNGEYDHLVYGRVKSDLKQFADFGANAVNKQHSGYGLRASLLLGHSYGRANANTWQFGPFIRYWHIKNSDIFVAPSGAAGLEPDNTRVQVGAKLRFLFR